MNQKEARAATERGRMILEAIGVTLATGILIVLPGWLLTNALFPDRSKLSGAERAYVTLAGGIFLLMLVGCILGFLPHGGRGALQSLATGGLPNVEVAMIAASLGLLWIGVHRGAYPDFAARFPRLASPWNHLKLGDQQP